MSCKLAYEAHDARAFTIPPHTCELSFGQSLPAPHRSPPDLLAVFLRLLASGFHTCKLDGLHEVGGRTAFGCSPLISKSVSVVDLTVWITQTAHWLMADIGMAYRITL